eukprot:m.648032 g.648032  ORF g.648032 m.648032 type:complete len:494 (-) comp22659_c0_seq24:2160-3641(-)
MANHIRSPWIKTALLATSSEQYPQRPVAQILDVKDGTILEDTQESQILAVYAKLSDKQLFVHAFFTSNAMQIFEADIDFDEPIARTRCALVHLDRYTVVAGPSFSLIVDQFSLIVTHCEQLGRPINCMDDQELLTELQSRAARQDDEDTEASARSQQTDLSDSQAVITEATSLLTAINAMPAVPITANGQTPEQGFETASRDNESPAASSTKVTLVDCTIAPEQEIWLAANTLQQCARIPHTLQTQQAHDAPTAQRQSHAYPDDVREDLEDLSSGDRSLFQPSHASSAFTLSGSAPSPTVSSGELLPAAQAADAGAGGVSGAVSNATPQRVVPSEGVLPAGRLSVPSPACHQPPVAPVPDRAAQHTCPTGHASDDSMVHSSGHGVTGVPQASTPPDAAVPPPLAQLTPPSPTAAHAPAAAREAGEHAPPAQRRRVGGRGAQAAAHDRVGDSGMRRLAVGGECLAGGPWEVRLGSVCVTHFKRCHGQSASEAVI